MSSPPIIPFLRKTLYELYELVSFHETLIFCNPVEEEQEVEVEKDGGLGWEITQL